MPSRYVEDDGRTVAPQGSLSTLYEDDLSGVATLASPDSTRCSYSQVFQTMTDDDLDDVDSEGIEMDDDSSEDDGFAL